MSITCCACAYIHVCAYICIYVPVKVISVGSYICMALI